MAKAKKFDAKERAEQLKEGLIGTAEEKLDSEVVQSKVEAEEKSKKSKKAPATKNTFGRPGMSIGGSFGRQRVRSSGEKKSSGSVVNPRRGVQKIWDDEPINNVGAGKSTYDVPKGRGNE